MMYINVTGEPQAEEVNSLGYCTRPLVEGQKPSHLELLLPPCTLLLIIFTGFTLHIYINSRHIKRARSQGVPYAATKEQVEIQEQNDAKCPATAEKLVRSGNLFTEFDLEVLHEINTNTNTPLQLLKISTPALVCLLLSSSFMLIQDRFFACMWPGVPVPSINVAVTCFLAPAGLVYALSFGFTFQFALDKSSNILNKITSELSEMDQMVTMVTKLKLPSRKYEMALYEAIKAEAIFLAMLIQNREPSTYKHYAKESDVKVRVWTIIDILKQASTHQEDNFNMNTILVERLVRFILKLNSICSDQIGILHTSIHPLEWVFLQILGTITMLGVLLIDAKSTHLEVALCELTAFSMAMLCYVLADLDSPFTGFFRVSTDVLTDVLMRLEGLYHSAASDWTVISLDNPPIKMKPASMEEKKPPREEMPNVD